MARPVLLALPLALLLALASGLAPRQATAPAEEPLPIFDTHIHYSADAWDVYDVDAALELLDRANVRVALVSSTPDDGTLRLHARAPDRIVPILRPYRSRADMGAWTRDSSVAAYVRERLESAPPGVRYRGIGELHLAEGETAHPVVAELARLAGEHDLFLHVHADAGTVEELLAQYPDAKVLWAHAGMSAGPDVVGRLLARFPSRLWVELALRYDVAPGGRLDPEWAALFARHPDRLMVGTDTWVPSQWTRLPDLMAAAQGWLRQLPPDLAERLAWRNAACLFGSDTTALRPERTADGCPDG
ncbi:MAG TPA: amidohydrolase family protein [Chloroflexota bacterium]|nr:amidohydrolase family protein [Chloroflexota bacterium]